MNANGRALLFIALGVFCACMAVLLARQWMQGERNLPPVSSAPVVETSPVIVALEDLPAGVALLASQVNVVEWPKAYLPSGHFSSPSQIDRRVLKHAISKGDTVVENLLLPVGAEAGLSSLILPDHRAISVKVDPVVAVAGFIKPGSRVDVLATLTGAGAGAFTQVILQDLKVLAINQELEKSESGEAKPEVTVVTLECDPQQSQKLAYAASEGKLQLALRNPTDTEVVDIRSTTGSQLLSVPTPPPVIRAQRPAGPEIETIRGSEVTRKQF